MRLRADSGAAMNPVCFVIMGFGKKTDLATGRELDLDKSYKNIIKPAVIAAGYDCVRADEIQHSGVIDVPMYQMLFDADLVVADLSTANLNAIFELGVRHALKPRATVIIAESKFTIPFDASHIVVRSYEHLGLAIDYDEAMRMQGVLTKLINALKGGVAVDSPVYTVLPDLQKPTRADAARVSQAAAVAAAQADLPAGDTYAAKIRFARQAMDSNAFALAQTILQDIYNEQTAPGADGKPKAARPFIVQQLALATYKAGEAKAKTDGPEHALAGYAEAEALLRQLDVETTTDPETLGLWSAIYKRRAEMATRSPQERKQDLNEAIRASERCFIIKRDYYNGTNFAYLLNLRASISSGDDRIADNVLASRVRREVVEITARSLAALPEKSSPGGETTLRDEKYWTAATHAESLIALGDQSGEALMQKAIASAPAQWMADSTKGQLARLLSLLATMHS
jgi:hypothetical protein